MQSHNPFAGGLQPTIEQDFVDVGDQNGTSAIKGDANNLKIAVEGGNGPPVHPLSIEDGSDAPQPSATWIQAAFHTITAVVGAGVLGLPHAFSYLGFGIGCIMLTVAGASSLYTAWLLASMHESNGIRHNRYRDLGAAILGTKLSNLFIVPFQFAVMIGLAVAYTVTGGKSLQVIEEITKDCDFAAADSVVGPECDVNLTKYIFVFAGFELLLSQIPSFHHLWWVSIIGAAMSLGYSFLAGVLAIVASRSDTFTATYTARDEGWALTRAVLNALGGITFAYGGHSVLLEIQATLKTPPSARDSMMKGITLASAVSAACYFFVAVTGYASYGDVVADDVLASHPRPARGWVGVANFMVFLHVLASYQVFAHPVFDAIETSLRKALPNLAPFVMRAVTRMVYVVLITLVAATFPFFGEIVGLIGALGFIPMTFIMPNVLWLKSKDNLGLTRYISYTLIAVFSIIAVLALIGSIASIAHKSSEFEYWT